MILIDTNILIYAYIPEYEQHPKAYEWLNTQFRKQHRIGLPWTSLLGFIRVAGLKKIHKKPIPINLSMRTVSEWISLENTWIPEPGIKHISIMQSILGDKYQDPNLVPDAHLAALSIEHGLKVCSADKDFAKFTDVDWVNPLL